MRNSVSVAHDEVSERRVADVELLMNAETKRVAERGGSDRLLLTSSGVSKRSNKPEHATKGYSTTLSISVLNKLLAVNYLRAGME
ncbi:hypothetical protein AB1Y20_013031 [Prymnesium parvum]|uniref:Uncharacterized protein n=1 Tax=Prymnesium parvum TaxID=97485 RepID=A0AB34IN06_PRYPA